jgi:hypothetical protein
MTAANVLEIVIGFMNAAFGLRAAAGFSAALGAALGAAFGAAALTAGLAAGFAAALVAGLAAVLAAGFFAAVAISRLLHKYLGKCAISRIANSGALCRVMQVFFVNF